MNTDSESILLEILGVSCLHFSRKRCFSMVKSLQKSRIIQLSAGIVLELFRIKEYNINIWQYRTKSVCRLCTPSACKFPVIFHKNAREYIKYSLRFLFHLTKNLTTHLPHNLCAVLPLKCICGGFLKNKRGQGTKPILMHLDDSGSTEQSQPDGFARNLPKNLMTHFTQKLYAVFSSLFAEATLCKTGRWFTYELV